MRRLHVFIIIIIVALGLLLSLVAISLYLEATTPSYYQSSWMNQMWQSMGIEGPVDSGTNGGMGGMMGGNGGGTTTNLWIIPVAIIAAVAIGTIGFSFYMIFPEIRNMKASCDLTKTETGLTSTMKTPGKEKAITNSTQNSCAVILKTMTPEEQKVLTVLMTHQGKYLQKYLGKETGLSRLKIHRIVARFAERGIVTAKPLGNTNEVTVSDWVSNSNTQTTQ